MSETVYCHSSYDDILAILRHNVPIESLIQGDTFYQHILAIDRSNGLWKEHLTIMMLPVEESLFQRQFAIFAHYLNVESLLFVVLENLAVDRRPYNLSFTCDGDILSIFGIDEGSERIDFYAFVACEHYRQIVTDESAEVQCRSLCEMQIDIRFHFDTSCLPFSGRNDYCASAFGSHFIDSLLDCLGVYALRSPQEFPTPFRGGGRGGVKFYNGLALGYDGPLQLWHLKRCRYGCNLFWHYRRSYLISGRGQTIVASCLDLDYMVRTTLIFLAHCFAWQSNCGCGSFWDSEIPYPVIALVVPTALNESGRRLVFCIDKAQASVGYGLHYYMLEPWICSVS